MRTRCFWLFWLAFLCSSAAIAQELAGWTVVESDHLRFHFPPQPRVDPAAFTAQTERAFVELQPTFSGTLPGKINFYVWNTSEEAERLLGRPVGFARPDLLLIHATAGQTPGHELTHVLLFHTVHPEQSNRFVEEGAAVAFDLTKRDRLALARAAIRRSGMKSLSISEIWQQGGRMPDDLLYPIAGSFVERLAARGGRERLLRLFKRQTVDNARTIYGDDFDRIVREFEAELQGESAAGPAAASGTQTPTVEELRAKAQQRMRQDVSTFSPEAVRELEQLYQTANRNLRAPESKQLLIQLVKKYPSSNRAGCAVLYLAQLSTGAEKEQYLNDAIASHADAWYGDGTQVGAFARAQLASLYAATDRLPEARKLADEVRTQFPGAIDHSGVRLVEALQRMKLLQ